MLSVSVFVGCAPPKAPEGSSVEGLTSSDYVVSGEDADGSLGGTGSDDGGDSGGGDSGSDGASDGSGDGSGGGSGSGSGDGSGGGSGDGSGGGSGDGSGGSSGDGSGGGSGETDADGDGFAASEDCDDSNADIYPGATEYCNGIDDDCDGALDAGAVDKVTSWEDADGDGYGNPDVYLWACNVPADHVLNDDDCDDDDASRNPRLGCDWNGTYTGTATLTATVSGLSDTCTATLTVDVDETASPAVVGDSTCSWSGAAAALIGDVDFDVEGELISDDEVDGEISIDGFGAESWSGSFSSPDNLAGTGSGSGTYDGYSYSYTLSLDLYR